MNKDLSPLEELKKKMEEEDLSERLKRGALIPNPPTEEETKKFINEVLVGSFEQIKFEIERYFKKVRYRKSLRAVSFYVTEEDSSIYHCRTEINPKRGRLYVRSEYTFLVDKYSPFSEDRYHPPKSTITMNTIEIKFAKLSEISRDQIIKTFAEKFFQRIKKKENKIESTKSKYEKYTANSFESNYE